MTASIGVALIPTDASVPSKLLQLADIALYRAKEGRNATRFFEPEMDARLQRRKAIERELRLALTRDQLELFYQPKISCSPMSWLASRRWCAGAIPSAGWCRPVEFIGIAEETGLILQLGEGPAHRRPSSVPLAGSPGVGQHLAGTVPAARPGSGRPQRFGMGSRPARARDYGERPDPAAGCRGEAA